jgi:hypothetical protein
MGRSLDEMFDPGGRPVAEATAGQSRINLSDPGELRRVGMALLDLADALDPEGASPAEELAEPGTPENHDDIQLAMIAKAVYLLRRRRKVHFPDDLFAEPAWDLLLDLFIDTVAGRRVSTKSMCAAADVPSSTALRWISILEGKGLVRRFTPPDDQRLTAVQMTSEGYAAMRKCLSDWMMASPTDIQKLRKTII